MRTRTPMTPEQCRACGLTLKTVSVCTRDAKLFNHDRMTSSFFYLLKQLGYCIMVNVQTKGRGVCSVTNLHKKLEIDK